MKILLINLCLRPESDIKIYPVGLGYVASSIYRAGYKLEILDIDIQRYSYTELENILRSKDFDVVGFGCIVTGYKIVKNLCSMIKKINRDAIIVVGNSVASSIPQLLLSNTQADIAVIGEGDITIIELLKALEERQPLEYISGICFKKSKEMVSTQMRIPISNLDDIPLPHWDLFDVNTYIESYGDFVNEPYPMPKDEIRVFPVNTARGCAYKCTFCYHVFRADRYRFRSPASIISEIKELKKRYGVNYIHFWDELTFFSPNQAEALVNRLLSEDLGIYWTSACRADLFREEKDLELAHKFKKSGCIGLAYSLESADVNILKAMNKHLDPQNFVKQKKILDAAGLVTWTSLVFGYPQETEETIAKTMQLCRENDIYPSVGYLLPQPGTPMYNYALANGFISDEEEYLLNLGDRQDLRINLTNIPSERFESIISAHLEGISKKLGLNLKKDSLIKTGHYRAKDANE